MRHLLVAIIAAGTIAAVQFPIPARSSGETPDTTIALSQQALTIVDANGVPLGTLQPLRDRTFRLNPIGTTKTAASATPRTFAPNLGRALTPGQIDAAYANEIQRFFNITHTP